MTTVPAARKTAGPVWLLPADLAHSEAQLASRFMRESWKYTSLKKFRAAIAKIDQSSPSRPTVAGASITPISKTDPAKARAFWDRALDAARYPLAVVAMNSEPGWFIDVAAGDRATITLSDTAAGTEIVFIDIAENAEVELIDNRSTASVMMQVVAIGVAEDARLTHHQAALSNVDNAGGGHTEWRLTSICLDRGAGYTLNSFACGSELRRLDTHVRFTGSHAHADLAGVVAVADRGHVDQQIVVEHIATHGKSEQRFNGIANGRGKFTFNGRIHIHPNAGKTDASLTNRNLALSSGCEINTKPELEIYTDDVRCAHGATIGKLAEDELFYLRSRGLDLDTATRLLTRAFLYSHARGTLAANALPVLMETL